MDMQSTLSAANKPENPTKLAIMAAGEKALLSQGYKAMSFRDLAAEVGIKSASVHYHFPTKSDLVLAVLKRYRADFTEHLVLPKKKRQAAQKALNSFIDGFRKRVIDNGTLSLCTVLAAEKSLLEQQVLDEIEAFYEIKVDWLATVVSYMKKGWMPTDETRHYAYQILASLHGASVLVQASGAPERFEDAMAPWRTLVERF
ncbi:TetR/AcrR family transcriptional regulator [Marinomonas ostreistagni]|uniref:TetR/AcrR family transcriptional regulator n=1 Tax=Marinomonas ostreistagni TaxID=359209 RepID=UPI001950CA8C|nr:TetR/AcrR family transcriptional regulator [Marinomonas ostreistagni]MBM6550692.1 TetR/AcrR family transcriptional regulator [Marinomonas ostreistagni]